MCWPVSLFQQKRAVNHSLTNLFIWAKRAVNHVLTSLFIWAKRAVNYVLTSLLIWAKKSSQLCVDQSLYLSKIEQ